MIAMDALSGAIKAACNVDNNLLYELRLLTQKTIGKKSLFILYFLNGRLQFVKTRLM
jgi:hypothetical protein